MARDHFLSSFSKLYPETVVHKYQRTFFFLQKRCPCFSELPEKFLFNASALILKRFHLRTLFAFGHEQAPKIPP